MKGPKKKFEWITGAELARRRPCSRSTVFEAEKNGHITKAKNGKFKYPDVIEQWNASANVAATSGQEKINDEKFNVARTRREIAEADLAEQELRQMLAQVLDAEYVRHEIARLCHLTRTRILGTVKGISRKITGLTDERQIARVIREGLERALRSLA